MRVVCWMVGLVACAVDPAVLDELPCPCAANYVCNEATERCIALVPQEGAGTACVAGFPEDFAEDLDRSRWAVSGGGDVREIDGDLVLSLESLPEGGGAFARQRERTSLEDCAVTAEVRRVPAQTPMFLLVRLDASTVLQTVIGEGKLSMGFRVPGMPREDLVVTPYDPEAHRWIGLRGEGNDVAWMVSADGETWFELVRAEAPFAISDVDVLFGLEAREAVDGRIEARFDNVNQHSQ